jgi:hypothetical protein
VLFKLTSCAWYCVRIIPALDVPDGSVMMTELINSGEDCCVKGSSIKCLNTYTSRAYLVDSSLCSTSLHLTH